MDKLKVGIAGYGIVGKRRHFYINSHPNLKVKAICDRSFQNNGKLDNGIIYFRNYKELFDEPLDILFVCLTNDVAAEVTIAGLEKGLHVFCEKPPGRNLQEIRPKTIFDEYLKLAKQDCLIYFKDSENTTINCPACDQQGEYAFRKDNFNYANCSHCETLYVNPRPSIENFFQYYKESESSKYWASTFYKKTAEARYEKIWKPKARIIKNTLLNYDALNSILIDIGSGYGVFAEAMRELTEQPMLLIEPAPHLAAICRTKGFSVIDKFLEEINPIDLDLVTARKTFVCFELFEHLHNPMKFLNVLNQLMNTNDLFIFTTLSSTGLDIQVLWEHSKAVSPPHHLNFFNPSSIKLLLERTNFEVLEITTPGQLDIDILEKNQNQIQDRFWKTFINQASVSQKEKMQEIIAAQGFSSHMMIVCSKR